MTMARFHNHFEPYFLPIQMYSKIHLMLTLKEYIQNWYINHAFYFLMLGHLGDLLILEGLPQLGLAHL